MPPPDLEADYDDEPDGAGVRFPMRVRIAGIIWIAFGALGLLGALIAIISSIVVGAQGPAPDFCAPACLTTIALVSLLSGVQTIRGTSVSIGGNAVASIGFGILISVMMAMMMTGGVFPQRGWSVVVLVGSIYFLVALSLVAAGVLALIGKSDYDKWREANGLNGPRRLTPEEEDYDDRPRPQDGDQST